MRQATREAFGQTLAELAVQDPDIIVLDADLAPATKTGETQKTAPGQFVQVGIAEGNMAGIAAGMAVSGLKPFASSFAMFLAGRAYEQIRNSIAYPHLNVKLCATHAGITVGEDGGSHQCLEDIGLMRMLPG
ncbi:transketolase family protein, partial [Faecalibaculum rodentium]